MVGHGQIFPFPFRRNLVDETDSVLGFPNFLDWVPKPVNSQLTIIFDVLEALGLIKIAQNPVRGRFFLLYWNGCAVMDSLFFRIGILLNLYVYFDIVYLKVIIDEIFDLATFLFIIEFCFKV